MPQVTLPQDIYGHLRVINGIGFTGREIDIIACVLSGRSVKRMASILSISPKTARNHIHNITLKLRCSSQERIRDIIEQSAQHEDLKAHYQWLKIRGVFVGILKKICTQIPHGMTSHFFYTGDLNHPLFQRLIKDLALSGIEVCVQNTEQTAIPIVIEEGKIHIGQEPYTYYLAIFEIINLNFPELDVSPYLAEFEGCVDGKAKGSIADDSIAVNKESFWSLKKHFVRWVMLGSFLGTLVLTSFFISGTWLLGLSQPVSPSHKGIFDAKPNQVFLSSWNLPFLPDNYVNRVKPTETVWEQLLRTANQAPGANQATNRFVGLSGPGGVGKTFLALYCIHTPKQPYAFRAWFNAETLDELKASYFELGEKLQLFIPRMSEVQKIREVKSWLENQGRVLLVYDNAATVDELYEFFPSNAHIIVTSRNYKIPNAIEVGIMTEDESLSLLSFLVPTVIKQDATFSPDSVTFVKKLNHFPLAISQAAAYITENVIPLSKYLELYAKERKNLLSNKGLAAGNQQQEPIYITWDINLESIGTMKEGKQALNLLGFIAFCHPGSIPKTLLMQCLYGKTDEKAVLDFNTLIGLLRRYSLIKATPDSISAHRLVSDWLRDKFTPEDRLKYLRKILVGIGHIYPKKLANLEDTFSEVASAQDFTLMSSFIPHIETVLLQLEPLIEDKEKISLYALYADSYYSLGNYAKSKMILEKLAALKERCYGANHDETVKTLTNLSAVLNSLGEGRRAEAILKKILAINEDAHGPNHAGNIAILELLYRVYHALGEGQKCLEMIERVLPLVEKHYAKDHPEVGKFFYCQARVSYLLGDFQKSQDLISKSLAIYNKVYGENHLKLGPVFQTLGSVYYAQGNLSHGKDMSEKALAVFLIHLRADHVLCAGVQINLGLMHYEEGNLEASKAYFQDALKTRLKYYGPDSIWTAFALANLGLVYASLGNEKEGKPFLDKSLLIIEKHYDEKPIWCSFLLNRIAAAYYLLGDHEKSEPLLIRGLEKIRDKYGKDHVFYAIIAANLGNVLRNKGYKEKSQEFLKEAYDTLKKYFGLDHPTTVKAQANLALWDSALGNHRKKGSSVQYPF